VVKPTVSATAYNTRCISRDDPDGTVRGPLMVQEFLPQITTEGEWSLVFSCPSDWNIPMILSRT
jgi:hypothetical protein